MLRFPALLLCLVLIAAFVIPQVATASGPSIYWGAYINGAPANQSLIDSFEADAGKKMSIQMFGEPWQMNGTYMAFPQAYVQTIRNRGAIPVVDWASWNLGSGNNQPNFQLADISGGAHDAYLKQWAASAHAWGHPFMIRMDAEMNGWWSPWSEQLNGNHAGDFAKAWRHVVDVFNAQGATNVTWVWCPNILSPQSTPLAGLYPGDSYVDWTCLDGYNWGTSPGNSGYWSFTQVFAGSSYNGNINSYQQVLSVAPSKPVLIGETAASESGGSKSTWITNLLGTELPNNFPQIKALLWFNWNNNDPNLSWPIESSSTATAAFKSGIASSYYATNSFGSISSSPIAAPAAASAPAPAPAPQPAPAPAPGGTQITALDVADSYTDATQPYATNLGASGSLRSDTTPIQITVIKFDLSSLAGKTLTDVTLRLHTTTAIDAGSGTTQYAYLVPDETWQEKYLSYNNNVAISSRPLGSVVPWAVNTSYEMDLNFSSLQAYVGGPLSLSIRADGGDAAVFYSREAGPSLAPQLLVTYK